MGRKRLQIRLTPWQIFKRSALICSLLGCVVFGLSLRKIEPLPLSGAPLRFNAQESFDYMARLSKGFPNRQTWTDSRKQAALWLKDEFRKLGYSPQGMQFSEVIAGNHYTDLENVYAEKRGTEKPDEIVVLMAHYDIAENTTEGAMDDASGVGVVMEMAKLLAHEQTRRTILFLITDSEEFGAFWGARAFSRSFERADRIVAAASMDFLAPEKQVNIVTLCSGLKEGYTPLWLRELALDSVRSVAEVKSVDFDNIVEFVERAVRIPPADHGPFLAAGIPAFNWAGQTANFAYEMAHYHHTKHDVVEAMQVGSFDTMGRAAEKFVRSIDALPAIPENFRDSSYWKVTSRMYLDGWIVTILHILAFIPFLAYSTAKFGSVFQSQPRSRILAVLGNEFKNVGILLGSLLLGYMILIILPALRIIDQYEVFPATQKSLLLYNPNFIAMLLVVGSVVVVYWIFQKTFAQPEDEGHVEIRHAVHAALLALIIFLAFLKNSYLGVLLLLPPAYFWTMMRARRNVEDRLLNMLLLLGGSITFVAVAVVMTTIFHVGVVYWYLFLSAAYGLISAYSVVLFFMALTVMIRLFRSLVF